MIIGNSGIGSGRGIGESYQITSKTYNYDVLFSLPANGYYAMNMTLSKTNAPTYTMTSIVQRTPKIAIPFNVFFLHTLETYEMTCKIIVDYRLRMPTDSIINTLFWSWATVLDQSYRNIISAANAITVYSAESTDLDRVGEIYHLKRKVDETDDSYKKRLITQTSVLIGHGTKDNCEKIVNQVIGMLGCNIIQSSPGKVRITFSNDDAMRSAFNYKNTLNDILPNMFAAGIEWDLYISLVDYLLDMVLLGMDECPYTLDIFNRHSNDIGYEMDDYVMAQNRKTFLQDIAMEKAISITYEFLGMFSKSIGLTYLMRGYHKKGINKSYLQTAIIKRTNTSSIYNMNELTLKNNINKSFFLAEYVKKARTSRYIMGMRVET
jgi:hypothetical protein